MEETLLGVAMAAITALSTALAVGVKAWVNWMSSVTRRLKECEDDRERLHREIAELRRQIGRLQIRDVADRGGSPGGDSIDVRNTDGLDGDTSRPDPGSKD